MMHQADAAQRQCRPAGRAVPAGMRWPWHAGTDYDKLSVPNYLLCSALLQITDRTVVYTGTICVYTYLTTINRRARTRSAYGYV